MNIGRKIGVGVAVRLPRVALEKLQGSQAVEQPEPEAETVAAPEPVGAAR